MASSVFICIAWSNKARQWLISKLLFALMQKTIFTSCKQLRTIATTISSNSVIWMDAIVGELFELNSNGILAIILFNLFTQSNYRYFGASPNFICLFHCHFCSSVIYRRLFSFVISHLIWFTMCSLMLPNFSAHRIKYSTSMDFPVTDIKIEIRFKKHSYWHREACNIVRNIDKAFGTIFKSDRLHGFISM